MTCVVVDIFVVLLYVVVVFFFFKQKTAYEMRISDWSSDVCSSDLCLLVTPSEELLDAVDVELGKQVPATRHRERVETALAGQSEIGRASCRESVCQYV